MKRADADRPICAVDDATAVRFELWDDDTFIRGGDDFLVELAVVAAGKSPFKWTVPTATSFFAEDIGTRSGEFEPNLDVRAVAAASGDELGRSRIFAFWTSTLCGVGSEGCACAVAKAGAWPRCDGPLLLCDIDSNVCRRVGDGSQSTAVAGGSNTAARSDAAGATRATGRASGPGANVPSGTNANTRISVGNTRVSAGASDGSVPATTSTAACPTWPGPQALPFGQCSLSIAKWRIDCNQHVPLPPPEVSESKLGMITGLSVELARCPSLAVRIKFKYLLELSSEVKTGASALDVEIPEGEQTQEFDKPIADGADLELPVWPSTGIVEKDLGSFLGGVRRIGVAIVVQNVTAVAASVRFALALRVCLGESACHDLPVMAPQSFGDSDACCLDEALQCDDEKRMCNPPPPQPAVASAPPAMRRPLFASALLLFGAILL